MAAITIIQPANGQPILTKIGQSSYNRQLTGVGRFNGTDSSGTLIVPGLSQIAPGGIYLLPLGAPASPYEFITIPLGTISATMGQTFRIPHVGTVISVALGTINTITADTANHWTFRLTNKSQSNLAIITADSSNSTDSDASPAGFGITAYNPHALFQAAAPADSVGQFDLLEFTATKAGTATTMTGCFLELIVTIGGTDETLFVATNADGSIPISNGTITVARTGNVKTSALPFAFTITGR
jgi:hypothetical protein